MTTTKSIAFVIAMLAAACSGKESKSPSKMPGLCLEGSRLLTESATELETETFRGVLNNTLDACSQACDEKDDPSCQRLDRHLAALCDTSRRVCDSLCADGTPGSLTKFACAHDSKN